MSLQSSGGLLFKESALFPRTFQSSTRQHADMNYGLCLFFMAEEVLKLVGKTNIYPTLFIK